MSLFYIKWCILFMVFGKMRRSFLAPIAPKYCTVIAKGDFSTSWIPLWRLQHLPVAVLQFYA